MIRIMAYRMTDIDGLIELMRDVQADSTAKEFAERLGVSPQYLCDLYKKRREPGPKILAALSATRSVAYRYSDEIAKEKPYGRKR